MAPLRSYCQAAQREGLAQADFASRRRGGAGFDGACGARADLTSAAFFAVGFDVAFGLAGAADVIVACVVYAAFFATDFAVRVGVVSTALARRAGFSAAFTVAFVLLAKAGFALRSGLSCLVGLPAGAFAGSVVFVATFDVTGFEVGFEVGFVAACAALPVVDLVGVIPLATVAALVALLGGAALANLPVSGVAGFAIRATFSAFLSELRGGFAVALMCFVVVGAVSQSVACFAATDCAFFAIIVRFTEDIAGWTETAGSAAFSAAAFAVLATFGLLVGTFVTVGFIS